MKNTIKVFSVIAIVSVFILSSANCFSQNVNSPDALKEYLNKQPANSPDKPIKVSITINDPMIKNVADVIKSSGKYVSLNITGNALKTIPKDTFEHCDMLVDITIPNGVTSIGEFAFNECKNLSNIAIPDSVIIIEESAFNETVWFNKQPNGLVYAGKVAYEYKGNMPANTNITLLAGTKGIADDAFCDCENLTSITIPNSVVRIGETAFWSCENLISITIPDSVTSIGKDAFHFCTNLVRVTFQGTIASSNLKKLTDKNTNYGYIGDITEKYLAGGAGTYTRPNSRSTTWTKQPVSVSQTTTQQPAGVSAEAGTPGLKYTLNDDGESYSVSNGTVKRGTVVIPAMYYDNLPITIIADQGFRFLDGITEVIIPNSITIIGYGAFAQDGGLTNITIPASVKEIWSQAFRGCNNLTSVTFQGTITAKNFINEFNFPGDLRAKYLAGGSGTYTRPDVKSKTWTKQQ